MNNLNRLIIFSIVLAIGFASCDGITDIEQPGNLPADEAIQTVDDMDLNLGGLYANMDILDQMYMSTIRTDEAMIGPGNGGQGLGGQYQFVLNSSSAIAGAVWNGGYASINEVNRFITAAEDIEPESSAQTTYNHFLGQAYAIRAFEYFKLLSFYSEDITDNSSLGVPTFTNVPDTDAQPTRDNTGATFDRIMSDIQTAENLIAPGVNGITRFTQDALTALRARIATYRENYNEAETLSQHFVDNYSLADPSAYESMFAEDTDGEVIFKLERTVNDNYDNQANVGTPAGSGWIGNIWAQADVTTGAHYQVESALAALMGADDIRRDVNILASQDAQGRPVDYVFKFSGEVPGEEVALMNDQKIFRVSEMYLINAEAKAANGSLNGPTGAAGIIQEIRTARSTAGPAPLPTYANQQEAFADILEERRVELAFEGHRWFDLRRMGPVAGAEIDRDETVNIGNFGCSDHDACDNGPVPGQDHRYVLPIPLNELDANSEIQQNPGYGGGS